MTNKDFSSQGVFYCKDAGEKFLEAESVDLFIGHPPYYMAEPELNGGDPTKQLQNAKTTTDYYQGLLDAILHMEYALKPNGHIFLALDNSPGGLEIISRVLVSSSLRIQSIRLWDPPQYLSSPDPVATVVFVHLAKYDCSPELLRKGPFVLKNSWEEASDELDAYHEKYATVGAAPTGLYRELIANFSREGDIVCDLFAGCGTVQVVALELGRKFIYNDVSKDKLLVATKRIEDYVLERQ